VEGMVAGVEVTTADLGEQLARRRLGFGRSPRMGFETDKVEFLGGVRHGRTQGGPVAVWIENAEWPKWEKVMSADPVDAAELAESSRNEPLTRPRPGHADLPGMQKYGFAEARPVLERASARETAGRTALGTVARAFLRQLLGVEVISHVVGIGGAVAPEGPLPGPGDLAAIDESPVRAFDQVATEAMVAEVEAVKKAGDTVGGVIEVIVYGLPPGLGSHVHWDRRLDARLAGALMGVQAMKGVEIGDGFTTAKRWGSQAHDEIDRAEGTVAGVTRRSNRAGGLEGGITNGEPLRMRVAMKPISTVPRALSTVDVVTGEPAVAIHQRSDVCAVPRAGVVLESVVALVLADAALEKFGGDSLIETRRNADGYLESLRNRW
ncbi:MAG: chorismate synthase, partial [Actinomycetota bacterium]|nr:chorismate synthase [Actinomycetota bacterium]